MTRISDYELDYLSKKNVLRYFIYWSSTEMQIENKTDYAYSSTNDYSSMQYDKIFCNKIAKYYLEHQKNNPEKVVDIGGLFSDAILNKKKITHKIKDNLNINNEKKIISVFDQKSNYKNILNHDEYKNFLLMIKFLLSKEKYYVLFKSKNYNEVFNDELETLRSEIYKNKNFINLNTSKISHIEAMSVSDASISCPLSSTSIESMSGKIKTIVFDPLGLKNYKHCITKIIPNLYCNNLSDLENLLGHYLNLSKRDFEVFINDYTLEYVDSFLDNNTIKRLNIYLD